MKNENVKIILISIFISITIFSAGIFIFSKIQNINKRDQKAQVINILNEKKEIPTPIIEVPTTTLFFVGDIMLTRGVESSVLKNFNGDYNKLFENLNILKNSDILFGNLEGDVSDKGNNVGSKYSFRMNPKILPVLKDAGFDIISFANNHVGDWNMSAFKDTLSRLEEIGILKTGAGQNKEDVINPIIIEKNGTVFGFLGFSDVGPNWIAAKENTAGILLASDPNLGEIIKNAKAECDVLIVSFHWGVEYKTVHNTRQENLAHTAIDNGADMVIGHHPHVMEDVEVYEGKPIVYSLGNFIFDQYFSKDTMRGMLFTATFQGNILENTDNKIITLNSKYQPEGIFTKEEIAKKDASVPKVASFVCPKPKKDYEDMALLDIGQNTALPDMTYIPSNLKELNSSSSTKTGICLVEEAKNMFEQMTKDAKEDGYTIKASSGFRTYDYQQILLSANLKKTGGDTSLSVAKPGYSEHQLGTAVDLTGKSIGYAGASNLFDESVEDKWLEENASDYGFIESYPDEKVDITGYMYEPWHYRYVGIDMAAEIIKSGQTINEFLAQ